MTKRTIFSIALAGLLACGAFLVASRREVGFGFPLDDAWIHQTYARNLVQSGEWAFVPGYASAGSTSPLWTLLLALGVALRVPHLVWTYALGYALLLGNAIVAAELSRRLITSRPLIWIITALAVVLEWHLVWAAVSGMETLALAFLASLVLWRLQDQRPNAALTGLLIGLAVTVRPDGLSLLPIAVLVLGVWPPGWESGGPRRRHAAAQLLWLALGLALILVPYLWFNYRLSGSIWPNTLYAKQAEYAVLLEQPPLVRLWQLAAQPFVVGGQVLLIPGLVWALRSWIQARDWKRLLIPTWALAFLGAYVLRLPVTYQHGRYLMPIIPIVLVLGVGGAAGLLAAIRNQVAARVLRRAWAGSATVLWLAFLALGAQAYARDVGFIETQLVAAARWMDEHISPTEQVAAHDIGALGYFAPRPIIDLAGLVSPEVIPLIRDETGLAAFLDARGTDYLLVFPSWYPNLTLAAQARAEHEFLGDDVPASIGPLVLYRWTPINASSS